MVTDEFISQYAIYLHTIKLPNNTDITLFKFQTNTYLDSHNGPRQLQADIYKFQTFSYNQKVRTWLRSDKDSASCIL